MVIQVDTREHKSEWERIQSQFDSLGVQYFRSKLYCGDYQSLDNAKLCIDSPITKINILKILFIIYHSCLFYFLNVVIENHFIKFINFLFFIFQPLNIYFP